MAVSNYELNQIISVCLKNQEAKSKAIHGLASPCECQLDQPGATIETLHLTCSSL